MIIDKSEKSKNAISEWDKGYIVGYEKGRADREEKIFKFLEEHYTACTNDGDYYDISEIREQFKENKND